MTDEPVEKQEQLAFDWDDESAWGEQPEVACGIENPDVCESCQ